MNFAIESYVKPIGFEPMEDKIAIVINNFTLTKNPDWPFRYSEPYIISMAIDQGGANNPAIDFSILPFPKVRKNNTVDFDGHGHLIYGPANPGEFVTYTILFMEDDNDMRNLGQAIEDIIKGEATNIGMKALLKASPTISNSALLLSRLSEIIASRIKKDNDDELYRRSGTLLRDVENPYGISQSFEGGNDFVKSRLTIVPLTKELRVNKDTKQISL
ncbi:hypothetical protein CHU92_08535 [Flavobacterium cyanobacteriorum]|uniref:Uncharacterized protein n=1 Tax=Flavobacterium cyanobacteriorum TaxID=2022802 RepID=A0A255Z717_9FLAO|nr:hypothetical protein [Flavobacterium cyanobacteriorum]OYQ37229.1 hypothetical protein CHU92_08535 [Flavobacterium cyanobacteriorum]